MSIVRWNALHRFTRPLDWTNGPGWCRVPRGRWPTAADDPQRVALRPARPLPGGRGPTREQLLAFTRPSSSTDSSPATPGFACFRLKPTAMRSGPSLTGIPMVRRAPASWRRIGSFGPDSTQPTTLRTCGYPAHRGGCPHGADLRLDHRQRRGQCVPNLRIAEQHRHEAHAG